MREQNAKTDGLKIQRHLSLGCAKNTALTFWERFTPIKMLHHAP
jgi:hypothetical protein